MRNTFGNAYYTFFNPANVTATVQTLTLPLLSNVFPFSNLGSVTINGITFYVVLSVPVGNTINANFGPTGGTSTGFMLAQASGQTPTGQPIDALTGSISPVGSPQSFTVTVPVTFAPSTTEDILLVIDYTID